MKYETKSLSDIKDICLAQEALIEKIITTVDTKPIDTAIVNNDYGVLKLRLQYVLKHFKKDTVRRNATADEISYYFSMATDIYSELKVPIRGKIDSHFVETLNTALSLTRKYLSKIEDAEV